MDSLLLAGHWLFAAVLGLSFTASYLMKKNKIIKKLRDFMKILFITAFPPCQKTAGQDYTRRLILDLIEKGHEVYLIYAEYPA